MKLFKVLGAAALVWSVATAVSAQDVLFKRNGDELSVKVVKISAAEVEYKKWSNPDGPTYSIPKAEVFIIKYQNGDKDVFEAEAPRPSAQSAANQSEEGSAPGQPICATPAENNQALIDEYNNNQHEYILKDQDKPKKKKAYDFIGTLGITATSILSTEDIEILLRQATQSESLFLYGRKDEDEIGDRTSYTPHESKDHEAKYVIEITNKTSQFIYIDKAHCFRQSSDGKTRLYYNSEKVSTLGGSNKGMGVNMGSVADALGVGGVVGTLASGVNVGGGKSNTTMIEHQDSRLLTIPPKGKMLLSKDDYLEIKGGDDIITGVSEVLPNDFKIPDLYRGEYREYTEENTPLSMNYTITYSSSQNFEKCYYLNFGVYIKDVYGISDPYVYRQRIIYKYYLKSHSAKTIVFGKSND